MKGVLIADRNRLAVQQSLRQAGMITEIELGDALAGLQWALPSQQSC